MQLESSIQQQERHGVSQLYILTEQNLILHFDSDSYKLQLATYAVYGFIFWDRLTYQLDGKSLLAVLRIIWLFYQSTQQKVSLVPALAMPLLKSYCHSIVAQSMSLHYLIATLPYSQLTSQHSNNLVSTLACDSCFKALHGHA